MKKIEKEHGPEPLLLSTLSFQVLCHELLNSVLARQSNQQRCRQMVGFQNATYAQGANLRSVGNSLGQSSKAVLLKLSSEHNAKKAFLSKKDLRRESELGDHLSLSKR